MVLRGVCVFAWGALVQLLWVLRTGQPCGAAAWLQTVLSPGLLSFVLGSLLLGRLNTVEGALVCTALVCEAVTQCGLCYVLWSPLPVCFRQNLWLV